jgi:hypothetical protein
MQQHKPTSCLDYAGLYASYDESLDRKANAEEIRRDPREAFESLPGIKGFVWSAAATDTDTTTTATNPREEMNGFKRMERCRIALDALDSQVSFIFQLFNLISFQNQKLISDKRRVGKDHSFKKNFMMLLWLHVQGHSLNLIVLDLFNVHFKNFLR